MKTIKSCGVLIVHGDPIDSFLLMRHPTRLDLPKGHVDPGESELECALRELEEETGIQANDIELDPHFRFTTQYTVLKKRYGDQPMDKTLVIFLGRLLNDVEVRPTEHQGFQWTKWDPPHRIQQQTIDPLLAELADYLAGSTDDLR